MLNKVFRKKPERPAYVPDPKKLWMRRVAIASPAFLHRPLVWVHKHVIDPDAYCPPYEWHNRRVTPTRRSLSSFLNVAAFVKNLLRYGIALMLIALPASVASRIKAKKPGFARLNPYADMVRISGVVTKSIRNAPRGFAALSVRVLLSGFPGWHYFVKAVGREEQQTDAQDNARYLGMLPYDEDIYESLPKTQPGQRSVIFFNYSYYHHYYLVRALRDRGWNALSIVLEDPASPSFQFYHGEDLNVWDEDAEQCGRNSAAVLRYAVENASMLLWHNENLSSLFDLCYQNVGRDVTPWDLIHLRGQGVKLGVSMSGCLTGTGQTEFNNYTGGVCNYCVWQDNPVVCSDAKNLAIGEMYESLTDLYAIEGDWVVNRSRKTEKAFREPLTFCLDHNLWSPDIEVPSEMRFERKEGEVLIFHAVGNYKSRNVGGKNIKGTPAVLDAIERLKNEGYPVRLVFVHDVHSRDMKYYQVQADIVVDQIIYGRYGASSRESMMLGRPTVTRLVREQPADVSPSQSLQECPLIDASPDSIYDVLKYLVENPEERKRIGEESRRYAVKWHSAEACAARFERVYDKVLAGNYPVDDPDIYHG